MLFYAHIFFENWFWVLENISNFCSPECFAKPLGCLLMKRLIEFPVLPVLVSMLKVLLQQSCPEKIVAVLCHCTLNKANHQLLKQPTGLQDPKCNIEVCPLNMSIVTKQAFLQFLSSSVA